MSVIVVIEGLDGTGKTTVAGALARRLEKRGAKVLCAREPGFTAIGEDIRNRYLLSKDRLDPLSQFYLFQVARIEMLREFEVRKKVIDYIVLDRFWPSTYAYQVHGNGVSDTVYDAAFDEVRKLVCSIGSEVDICLMLPEEIRCARMIEAGKGGDRYESMPPWFFDRVRTGYEYMVNRGWLHGVDASPDVDAIVSTIIDDYIDR